MGRILESGGERPFRFVKGRKGNASIIDCLLMILGRQKDGRWPKYSFSELTRRVSGLRSAPVPSPSIRCAVYMRPSLFSRAVGDGKGLLWKLSEEGQRIAVKKDSI